MKPDHLWAEEALHLVLQRLLGSGVAHEDRLGLVAAASRRAPGARRRDLLLGQAGRPPRPERLRGAVAGGLRGGGQGDPRSLSKKVRESSLPGLTSSLECGMIYLLAGFTAARPPERHHEHRKKPALPHVRTRSAESSSRSRPLARPGSPRRSLDHQYRGGRSGRVWRPSHRSIPQPQQEKLNAHPARLAHGKPRRLACSGTERRCFAPAGRLLSPPSTHSNSDGIGARR